MADDSQIEVLISAQADALKDGMDQAKTAVSDATAEMKGSLEQLAAASAVSTSASINSMKQSGGGGGSRMEAWRQELEEIKEEGNLLEQSKSQERAFWQEKLALCQQGSVEYLQVKHRLYELDVARRAAVDSFSEAICCLRVAICKETACLAWATSSS